MTTRPPDAEQESRQMAERLVALFTGAGGKATTRKRQQTAETDPAKKTISPPDPAVVTWTRAQLRERIQQVGAELAPISQPAGKQTREADRSPQIDREIEP